jgi:glycosyltransferase involved in cell wall biosynthesis
MQFEKKKVLYIFCSSNYSGAEVVMSRLIGNNEFVTPVILSNKSEFSDLLANKGYKVFINNSLSALNRPNTNRNKILLLCIVACKFLSINAQVLYLLLTNRIHAVHSNNLTASVYISPTVLFLKAVGSKIKTFWSNHDLVYTNEKKMELLALRCVSFFDKTFAVSVAVRKKFPSRLQHKIIVLYNGIDLDQFVASDTLRYDFRRKNEINDEIVFAIVGLIIKRKGHALLIDAFKVAAEHNPTIKLLIVGKFLINEPDYKELVLKMIDNKRIKLLNHTNNIAELYSGIDVLVNASLPELSEPLGTTIYEAMAYHKVALASDTGGSPEIIEDGVNGFLFKAGSRDSLICKLQEILDLWPSMEPVRDNARKSVEVKFNVKHMVQKYNISLGIGSNGVKD